MENACAGARRPLGLPIKCWLFAILVPGTVLAEVPVPVPVVPGGHASAQPVNAVKLKPVIVSATRVAADALVVPAAIDVLDTNAIHRGRPAIDLSETLGRIPGVVARDRQNQAQDLQISIRGFGARAAFGVRGVRLYTDGIPATMPDGQGQVSHFSLASAERIEVLRGPFSALYGNASGGVISLFTASAPSEPVIGAGFSTGAFGLQHTSLSFQTPWGGSGDGSLVGDAADVRSDGYREHSRSRRRSAQAVLKGSVGQRTGYAVLANGLDLVADDPQGLTVDQVRGDRRAASQGALAFDTRKTVKQGQLGVRLDHAIGDAQTVTATVHSGSRHTTQMLSVPVIVQRKNPMHGGGAIDLDREYSGVDLRWQWSSLLLDQPFSITTGVEYQVSAERRRGFENFVGDRIGVVGRLRRDQRDEVSGRDAYLQADWTPAERWRINVGARRSQVRFRSNDHYITANNPDDSGSLDYSRTSPVVGALFRATPWLSLYANAGGGFETPTLSELAYRNDGLSGLNDALAPARSRNFEAGVRARREDWEWSGAVFQSRTRDELVVVANEGGRSVYGNAGVSRRRGAELAGSVRLAPQWHLAGSTTFLDARYLTDFAVCATPPCGDKDLLVQAGRGIPGLARQSAWSELRWSPGEATDVMLEAQFNSRVFVDDANSAAAPGYSRFDLAAERRFDAGGLQWRGFARLNNLFDRDIIGSVIVNDGNGRYYEPAPGRHWQLGLSAKRRF